MIQQIIILLVGFIFLVKGADWFVDGAASIARKMGIPQLIIGLTIVAMGTSMPEAAVSITAAMQQNAGITIGNVVGSNILNIFIILGITALITNVKIQKSTIRYEIPFMIFITIILMIFGMTDMKINFIEGVFLWILFIAYLVYLSWQKIVKLKKKKKIFPFGNVFSLFSLEESLLLKEVTLR